jgi:hypothetical protein
LAARTKLYEFDRVEKFSRKIAAAANAAGQLPLFF